MHVSMYLGSIGEACHWAGSLCETSQGGSLFSPVEAVLICRRHTSQNKTFQSCHHNW